MQNWLFYHQTISFGVFFYVLRIQDCILVTKINAQRFGQIEWFQFLSRRRKGLGRFGSKIRKFEAEARKNCFPLSNLSINFPHLSREAQLICLQYNIA